MHCYTVVLFLCAFIAQAACMTTPKAWKMNITFKMLQNDMQTALQKLEGKLPDDPCTSLNLTALSSPCCYTHNMLSMVDTGLNLTRMTNLFKEVEKGISGRASDCNNCTLPITQDMSKMEKHFFVKCMLQDLDQWLKTAKSTITA